MREVIVAGVGVHNFGKFVDKSLKELGRVALKNALDDAGLMPKDIQAAFFGNAYGGLITGQESVRGQTILLHSGISAIPWSDDNTIRVCFNPTVVSMKWSRSAMVWSSARTTSSFSRLDGPKK